MTLKTHNNNNNNNNGRLSIYYYCYYSSSYYYHYCHYRFLYILPCTGDNNNNNCKKATHSGKPPTHDIVLFLFYLPGYYQVIMLEFFILFHLINAFRFAMIGYCEVDLKTRTGRR